MADEGTDNFVGGALLLLLIFGLYAAAQGGVPSQPTSTTTPDTAPPTVTTTGPPNSTQSTTNIPGGTLFMCNGDLISTDSVAVGTGTMTLRVYYAPVNGGRNCAIATRTGVASLPGQMYTTLRFDDYQGDRWPNLAYHRSTPNAGSSGGVYLDDTDGACVRARVAFRPSSGGSQTVINSGRVSCDSLSDSEVEEGSGPSGRRR
jgi:hypothetical protein